MRMIFKYCVWPVEASEDVKVLANGKKKNDVTVSERKLIESVLRCCPCVFRCRQSVGVGREREEQVTTISPTVLNLSETITPVISLSINRSPDTIEKIIVEEEEYNDKNRRHIAESIITQVQNTDNQLYQNQYSQDAGDEVCESSDKSSFSSRSQDQTENKTINLTPTQTNPNSPDIPDFGPLPYYKQLTTPTKSPESEKQFNERSPSLSERTKIFNQFCHQANVSFNSQEISDNVSTSVHARLTKSANALPCERNPIRHSVKSYYKSLPSIGLFKILNDTSTIVPSNKFVHSIESLNDESFVEKGSSSATEHYGNPDNDLQESVVNNEKVNFQQATIEKIDSFDESFAEKGSSSADEHFEHLNNNLQESVQMNIEKAVLEESEDNSSSISQASTLMEILEVQNASEISKPSSSETVKVSSRPASKQITSDETILNDEKSNVDLSSLENVFEISEKLIYETLLEKELTIKDNAAETPTTNFERESQTESIEEQRVEDQPIEIPNIEKEESVKVQINQTESCEKEVKEECVNSETTNQQHQITKISETVELHKKPSSKTKAIMKHNSMRTGLTHQNPKNHMSSRSKHNVQQCFAQLENKDWEVTMKGLKNLSQITKQDPEQLDACPPGTISRLLGRHIKNLRSQVSRAACSAAGDVFSANIRIIDQDLDDIVRPLLHRTADTNKFLRADSNSALDRMVEHFPAHRTIGIIVHRGATHQNPIVRAATGRLLSSIVDYIGSENVMILPRDVRDKLLNTSAKLLIDGNLNARNHAKAIFRQLRHCEGFRKTLADSVSESTLRHIDKTLRSL